MELILVFLFCICYFILLVKGLPQQQEQSVDNNNNNLPWSPTSSGLQNVLPSGSFTPPPSQNDGLMGDLDKMKLGYNAYNIGKQQVDKILNTFNQ